MTKPEGYEGHYADAATEREAEQEKMRAYFDAWDESVGFLDAEYIWCAWEVWQFRQKEIDTLMDSLEQIAEQYKLLGYIEESNVNYGRAEHIYIVDEDGFDGCTVPVFIKGE